MLIELTPIELQLIDYAIWQGINTHNDIIEDGSPNSEYRKDIIKRLEEIQNKLKIESAPINVLAF